MTRLAMEVSVLGLVLAGASHISAQNYPNKPVRLVAPGSGGSGDVIARWVAEGLSSSLGQQVIVDNRFNIVAIETVVKAPSDGYTLLIYGNGLWTMPLLRKVSYDPTKDFSPISPVSTSPNVITVYTGVPATSVRELIALAKAKPGQLNFASAGGFSIAYLSAELFKSMAGITMTHIPYKSQGQALIDLAAGQVQLMFINLGAVAPHLKSGRIRAVALMSAQPSALAPGLPTVAASGLPGYVVASNTSLWAPAKTPAAIIDRLNQEVVRFLSTAETKERFLSSGVDVVIGSSEDVANTMKSEIRTWGKLIKELGIHEG